MYQILEPILDPDRVAAIQNSVWKILDTFGLEQTKMLQVSLSPSYEEELRAAKNMEREQMAKGRHEDLPRKSW